MVKLYFYLEKCYLEITVSNNVTNVVMVNTYNKELVKIQTMQVIHTYDIGDDKWINEMQWSIAMKYALLGPNHHDLHM